MIWTDGVSIYKIVLVLDTNTHEYHHINNIIVSLFCIITVKS